MKYEDTPTYTTDVILKVYVRYKQTPVPEILPFISISERYQSESDNYVVGNIKLKDLIANKKTLNEKDVFIVNLSRFFKGLDDEEREGND